MEIHIVRIGELLRKVLDKQKENIKEAVDECIKVSDREAGEIIAKKIMESNLV